MLGNQLPDPQPRMAGEDARAVDRFVEHTFDRNRNFTVNSRDACVEQVFKGSIGLSDPPTHAIWLGTSGTIAFLQPEANIATGLNPPRGWPRATFIRGVETMQAAISIVVRSNLRCQQLAELHATPEGQRRVVPGGGLRRSRPIC